MTNICAFLIAIGMMCSTPQPTQVPPTATPASESWAFTAQIFHSDVSGETSILINNLSGQPYGCIEANIESNRKVVSTLNICPGKKVTVFVKDPIIRGQKVILQNGRIVFCHPVFGPPSPLEGITRMKNEGTMTVTMGCLR